MGLKSAKHDCRPPCLFLIGDWGGVCRNATVWGMCSDWVLHHNQLTSIVVARVLAFYHVDQFLFRGLQNSSSGPGTPWTLLCCFMASCSRWCSSMRCHCCTGVAAACIRRKFKENLLPTALHRVRPILFLLRLDAKSPRENCLMKAKGKLTIEGVSVVLR